MNVAVGLASGLGNTMHMLPVIKVLRLLGHHITLFVQTDFPTSDLWRRCIYAADILDAPAALHGFKLVCGAWRPADWKRLKVTQAPLQHIHACEWKSNFKLARLFGYSAPPPDVTDWCRNLDRTKRWDFGIVPGCKGGIWLRKRYPGMAAVAAQLREQGLSVAVFGLPDDGIAEIPGEPVDTRNIAMLPDALAGCRVVIGTDSGLTFLASSLGIPVVEIYTATSEVKAAPLGLCRAIKSNVPCRPCVSTSKWQACQDWKCREIDPELVVGAAEELLLKSLEEKGTP